MYLDSAIRGVGRCISIELIKLWEGYCVGGSKIRGVLLELQESRYWLVRVVGTYSYQ